MFQMASGAGGSLVITGSSVVVFLPTIVFRRWYVRVCHNIVVPDRDLIVGT